MYTSIITKAERSTIQESGEEFLDVGFDILSEEEEVVDTKRLGFSTTISTDEITDAVAKYVANYEAEAVAKVANTERNQALAQSDAVIAELLGLEVTPDDITKA